MIRSGIPTLLTYRFFPSPPQPLAAVMPRAHGPIFSLKTNALRAANPYSRGTPALPPPHVGGYRWLAFKSASYFLGGAFLAEK